MGDTWKARYDTADSQERNQFLQRARHNALLTVPSAMPLEGHHRSSHLVEAYQGLGSYAVSNLSNRMTSALLPAGRPYMRLDLTPEARLQNGGEVPPDLEKQLALYEQIIQAEMERADWRGVTLQQIEQLMVAGSVAEFQHSDNTLTTYRLDQFVCRSNRKGKLLELIVKECEYPDDIPLKRLSHTQRKGLSKNNEGEYEFYTRVWYDVNEDLYYEAKQTDTGAQVGERVTYPVEELPWRVHRWSKVPGESYGRSKVELHCSDLRSLETLEKAGLELAAMAGFHFIAVAPGATAPSIRNRLKEIQNGGMLMCDPASIELKSFANGAGYQLTEAQISIMTERLSKAFLLMAGARRNAERVTATEIQSDIEEIEGSVGGVFGTIATDVLAARTALLIINLVKANKAPPLPPGMVSSKILTGLEALSRERDAQAAMQGAQVVQAFGPDATDVVKLSKLIGRAFVGMGLPDMVRSEEEAQQFAEQREARQAAMQAIQAAAPKLVEGNM